MKHYNMSIKISLRKYKHPELLLSAVADSSGQQFFYSVILFRIARVEILAQICGVGIFYYSNIFGTAGD